MRRSANLRSQVASPKRKARMSALIAAVEKVGPNAAEVARVTNLPEESVRYTLQSLKRRGYSIRTLVKTRELGMRKFALVVDLDVKYRRRALEVFFQMDEKWFVREIAEIVPDGRFVVVLEVPEEHTRKHFRLIERLQEIGFIDRVHQHMELEWTRVNTMNADSFDFRTGSWEVDWSRVGRGEAQPIGLATRIEGFDQDDLALLNQRVGDPSRPLAALAESVGISYLSALRHLGHVKELGLIEGYRVNWINTRLLEGTRVSKRAHKYLITQVFTRDVSDSELRKVRDAICALPFLWFESGGKNYHAELMIPLEMVTDALKYLKDEFRDVRERTEFDYCNWDCRMFFTVPTGIFDERKGRWSFDVEGQIESLQAVLDETTGPRI